MNLENIEFWSFDKLVEKVETLTSRNVTFEKNLGVEMSTYLKSSNFVGDKEHEKNSKSWLSWCSQQKNRVKVSEFDIPAGILGPKLTGSIYDIKVSSRGPDDAAYNKYPDLR